jgi:hypothetical protein
VSKPKDRDIPLAYLRERFELRRTGA